MSLELPAAWDAALLKILEEGDADRKASLVQTVLARRDEFDLSVAPKLSPPDRPARPSNPVLVPPQEVPRRGLGTEHGRGALLHALAHIELNAVDLAADMALRFSGEVPDEDRAAFVGDWIQVAGEEGLHFSLLSDRLSELKTFYGAYPAHDGLWDAARKTKDDLFGRLTIAPMILEARGLDVTPGLIEKLDKIGDHASVSVLKRIYEDEIGHVRTGVRWFKTLVLRQKLEPEVIFQKCVMRHYPAGPKRPFNVWARGEAELPQDWYEGVAPQ